MASECFKNYSFLSKFTAWKTTGYVKYKTRNFRQSFTPTYIAYKIIFYSTDCLRTDTGVFLFSLLPCKALRSVRLILV